MAHSLNYWRRLIREEMECRGIANKTVANLAGINWRTLRRFLKGHCSLPITSVEAVLAVFKYELDAVQKRKGA